MYVSLNMQPAVISVLGVEMKPKLPKGCKGILLVFDSKEAVVNYFGNDTGYIEIEKVSK